jgi:hypothetical protein
MKYGFMALAGVVGYIVSTFLSSPPGMQLWVKIVGIVAAIGGGALGIAAHKASGGYKLVFVVLALAVFLAGIAGFRSVSAGEPGSTAANILLVWTAVMFLPIGFLIELAALKLTADGKSSSE